MINLNRSPFLKIALEYIASHPGCSKADVICSLGHCPNRTYAYRNAAIGRLISEGLVRNYSTNPSKYSLLVP